MSLFNRRIAQVRTASLLAVLRDPALMRCAFSSFLCTFCGGLLGLLGELEHPKDLSD